MLRELAVVDPLAPEIGRALGAREGLVGIRRGRMLGPELARRRVLGSRPGEGHVRLLALAQCLRSVRPRALEAHPKVSHESKGHVAVATSRHGLAIARA